MSYGLCITRGRHPWDNAGALITPVDIRSLIDGDDSLAACDATDEPRCVRWLAHSSHTPVTFRLEDGNVIAVEPDRETIAKLVDISNVLRGRVLGDGGERYARDGTWTHPGLGPSPAIARPSARDRRGFFRGLFGIIDEQDRADRPNLARQPFRKGDTIRDTQGFNATVVGIEFVNGAGLDLVVIRYADGRLRKVAVRSGQIALVRPVP